MEQVTWKSNLGKLVRGEHLTAEETEWFVDDLMRGNADPAAVGAVLATQPHGLHVDRRARRDGSHRTDQRLGIR